MEILFDRDMKGIFILQIHRDYIDQQEVGTLKIKGRPTVVERPDLLKSDQITRGYPMPQNETEALADVNRKRLEKTWDLTNGILHFTRPHHVILPIRMARNGLLQFLNTIFLMLHRVKCLSENW